MDKIVTINENSCCGDKYQSFIDYAFSRTDYFMLVYVNYYGKGYTKAMKSVMKELSKFKVKSRTNPSWPGTLGTYSKNTSYRIVFYKNDPAAKKILKNSVRSIDGWTCPDNPQDLAFFDGNICWFYSVGHEGIACVIHANKDDIVFLKNMCLSDQANVEPYDDYYDAFNEKLTT